MWQIHFCNQYLALAETACTENTEKLSVPPTLRNKTYPLLSKYFVCPVLTVLGFCFSGPGTTGMQKEPLGKASDARSAGQRLLCSGGRAGGSQTEQGPHLPRKGSKSLARLAGTSRARTPPCFHGPRRFLFQVPSQPRQIFACTERRSSSSASDRRTLGLSVSSLSTDPD